METDKLYELAFQLKKAKPWDAFSERQIFAAGLQHQAVYIQVTGMDTEIPGIAVFPGEDSLRRYRRLLQATEETAQEKYALALGQDTVQVLFGKKDNATAEEQDAIRKYTKTHGINLRGGYSWPLFGHSFPYQPVADISEEDAGILTEAIQAACWLASYHAAGMIRIPEMVAGTTKIPLLKKTADGYDMKELELEPLPPAEYPVGRNQNDLYKARVKKLKKKGKWYCEVQIYPDPCEAEGVEGLYYPWNLLTYGTDDEEFIEVQMVRDYENRTEVMLDKLMEAIIREKVCPQSIAVSDDRTEALLGDWCREMDIRLCREERPEEIEDLLYEDEDEDDDEDYYEYEDENEQQRGIELIEFLTKMIKSFPEEVLLKDSRKLEEIRRELAFIAGDPMLKPELRKKVTSISTEIDRLIEKAKAGKPKQKNKKRKNVREKTLVISVSLESGCYRHIRISNQALLSTLSEAILDAFEFDDDHAHAFFMDNRAFSRYDCYYVREIEDDHPKTDEVSLEDTGIQIGQKFKYVFDFGDEWTFQCRVLKELDEITKHPEVIRSRGEAPEQYPDWEDDWDADDDWEDDWDEDDE